MNDARSFRQRTKRWLLAALWWGLAVSAAAQPGLPSPPPLPAPGAEAPREPGRNWRNLSPEQREAIRRLSRERRDAQAARSGGAGAPGRLSPEERRQLRAQIREEHERRSGRLGGAKRF